MVNGSDYYSHYLTLLNGQNVTIKIDKDNMDNGKMSKDPNFYVKFTPSEPVFSVNGNSQLQLNHTELSAMNGVDISSTDPGSSDHFSDIKNIKVTDQCDDNARGQLMVFSGNPVDKNVTMIYVDHGSGYPPISSTNILNHLNDHSHNQLMRKWNADTENFNISSAYSSNPSNFTASGSIARNNLAREWAIQHAGMALLEYCFVTNLRVNSGATTGSTAKGSIAIGIFDGGTHDTYSHEFGHALDLPHVWNTGFVTRDVSQYSTRNYMDYTSIAGDNKRNFFWLYQMINVF